MLSRNFNFLKKYLDLQRGVTFDEIFDMSASLIAYCKLDKSFFCNFALISKALSFNEINAIEKKFGYLDRIPTFYFENGSLDRSFVNLLEEGKYKKSFEDSWMFWQGKDIEKNDFSLVKRVSNLKDLSLFLDTLNASFQKDDPRGAYGELGDYIEVAERAWREYGKTDRLEYFIVCKDSVPVAVSALTNYAGIGYISNVGSLKEVRGQGYGKLATLYCVEQSKKQGNACHCLATEVGTYPYRFYTKIGFKNLFSAPGYTLKVK